MGRRSNTVAGGPGRGCHRPAVAVAVSYRRQRLTHASILSRGPELPAGLSQFLRRLLFFGLSARGASCVIKGPESSSRRACSACFLLLIPLLFVRRWLSSQTFSTVLFGFAHILSSSFLVFFFPPLHPILFPSSNHAVLHPYTRSRPGASAGHPPGRIRTPGLGRECPTQRGVYRQQANNLDQPGTASGRQQ